MRRIWRVYRLLCVAGFSPLLLATIAVLAVSTADDALQTPTVSIPAPAGGLQLRVFTAGQGSLPPDYRAGMRFVLYDPAPCLVGAASRWRQPILRMAGR